MSVNLGIGFVTGRKHFQNVLKTYVNNWLEYGLIKDASGRLHLFVAYDLKYHDTLVSDYKNIPPEAARMIDSINFYGKAEVDAGNNRPESGRNHQRQRSRDHFRGRLCKKRNVVTYFAVKHKMDKLLFIDDDEYPVATLKKADRKCIWMGQSVVGNPSEYTHDAQLISPTATTADTFPRYHSLSSTTS